MSFKIDASFIVPLCVTDTPNKNDLIPSFRIRFRSQTTVTVFNKLKILKLIFADVECPKNLCMVQFMLIILRELVILILTLKKLSGDTSCSKIQISESYLNIYYNYIHDFFTDVNEKKKMFRIIIKKLQSLCLIDLVRNFPF